MHLSLPMVTTNYVFHLKICLLIPRRRSRRMTTVIEQEQSSNVGRDTQT